MLVLTRKADQTIAIGDEIKIRILEIGNGYVKLGIDAPRDMPIHRAELYEKLKQLNVEAAKLDMERLKDFLEIR
ncbi:MAG: carbon storage regulator CsrA [Nitrospiraceae bacterium]|jgi:carbon storage regulator|nr:carbon storage regulator CsrA [Nitrospiraceae bacterium]